MRYVGTVKFYLNVVIKNKKEVEDSFSRLLSSTLLPFVFLGTLAETE